MAGGGAPWPNSKVLARCNGEGKRALKHINSTINSQTKRGGALSRFQLYEEVELGIRPFQEQLQ